MIYKTGILIVLALLLVHCNSTDPAQTDTTASEDTESADPNDDTEQIEVPEDSETAQEEITPDILPDEKTEEEQDLTPEPPLEATGFFYVAQREGRYWLVTPEGNRFYSIGVNHINPNGYVDQTDNTNPYAAAVSENYDSHEHWAEATLGRLESWGFNTVGAWSQYNLFQNSMAFTIILNMSGANWETGEVPDYFSEAFEERCQTVAAEQVAPQSENPLLIGWFIDNELRWGKDWRSANKSLLDDYLEFPEGAPGREVAESYRTDEEGFLLVLASRYFEVTTRAIREQDSNHMILGIRSVNIITPPQIVQAAAPWLDVYSVNNYTFDSLVYDAVEAFGPSVSIDNQLLEYHELTGLPLMITEFSFRADDSGLPNYWPPIYPDLDTQTDRADAYEEYVTTCFETPYIIGHHWFEYFDDPPGGRFDGEDSNFGIVDNNDNPWEILTDRMTQVNSQSPHLP